MTIVDENTTPESVLPMTTVTNNGIIQNLLSAKTKLA